MEIVFAKRRGWAPFAMFLTMQVVLACWWAAFYPGLFSRDSVLYLSHTIAGPWVSDHSVLYDSLLWLSYSTTGDIGAVTFLQTTAMAAALTYLARSLGAMGAPRRTTAVVAVLLTLTPTVGVFATTLWKDVPFTICAVTLAAACAGMAAERTVTTRRLLWLGLLMTLLGLFRANGFLIVGIAVVVLLLIVSHTRLRLVLVGTVAAAVPLLLNNLIFPQVGIAAPSKTYVYHTAFGDIAVAYRDHPELFTDQDKTLMSTVAPLTRWSEGGTCYTINELIWRDDFSWAQADAHAGQLLDLWKRLLVSQPAIVIDARLCRGAIAWKLFEDQTAFGGDTYRFSLRPNADTYVGAGEVPDFQGRWVFSLRPLSPELHQVGSTWLTTALESEYDWLLWRGAFWSYLSYLVVALAALALRNRYVVGVAAIVAGQQLAILANISAQDFRYMATPIIVGAVLVPLLVASVVRLVRRRPPVPPVPKEETPL
ncbi:DUF6020 family protein [Nonomuraea rhizosphaerae]|uniref:DUF6020 family protein n=1 Tax=Nonomuraea rhizosphaerae TaxID=2665663 RepID=UPI001C5DF67C|nr:DUF6020 family protein [Nonomuraea rhizosphaerae]